MCLRRRQHRRHSSASSPIPWNLEWQTQDRQCVPVARSPHDTDIFARAAETCDLMGNFGEQQKLMVAAADLWQQQKLLASAKGRNWGAMLAAVKCGQLGAATAAHGFSPKHRPNLRNHAPDGWPFCAKPRSSVCSRMTLVPNCKNSCSASPSLEEDGGAHTR